MMRCYYSVKQSPCKKKEKMKSLRAILIVIGVITLIITLFLSLSSNQKMITLVEGNLAKQPIPIILNHFQDTECGMVIDNLNFASQIVAPDGKTWFFHDHGSMVVWLNRKPFKKEAVVWVYAKDTQKWIDGYQAWYSRDEETPMLYGFGAYEKKQSNLIPFETMQLHMLRGETMANPIVRQQLIKQKGESNGSD